MRQIGCAALLALAWGGAAAGQLQSYYNYDPPPVPGRAKPVAQPVAKQPAVRKAFVLESKGEVDGTPTPVTPSQPGKPHMADNFDPSDHGALPPNLERGVKDLEEGMEDLSKYTGTMAAHVQKNGLRGFLAVPPHIKAQGQAVGRKIGNGINGIATDTARDMLIPSGQ